MTYIINSYSGTPIASIPDKTINTTATSLRLPGRNYPNYGEPVVENLVWMLENFAGAPTSGPTNPRIGQLWYDISSTPFSLKVYNGSAWVAAATPNTTPPVPPTPPGPTPPGPPSPPGPVDPVDGELLYDQTKKQLFVRGSGAWNLVGPIGAADGNDANSPSIPGYTSVDALYVTDTLSATHKLLRLTVGGQLVAVVSNDATFTPASVPTNPLAGFAAINPGITLNPSIPNIKFNGVATSTTQADNADFLGGNPASSFMRKDQTNLPTNDNLYNLGSASNRYNTVYATSFDGTATQATTASTLNGISPNLYMRRDQNNVPTGDNAFDLGSVSNALANTFSNKFIAGAAGSGPLYVFKNSLNSGFGTPADNMLSFYITGTETVRLVNRSMRLGDPTIDAGLGASPSLQPAFLSLVMNQANTDGMTIRASVSGPGAVQPTTMLNLWANIDLAFSLQNAIIFRTYFGAHVGGIVFNNAEVYYTSSSDYRRKKNIRPVSNALAIMSSVGAKQFTFDTGTDEVIGLLAHEVQSILPHAVTGKKDEVDETGKPVFQTLDYSKLVPLLWAAVQELSDKLKTLEEKLAS